MKKEDIHFGDWQRMFIGDVPAGFYWEVVLRIAVIYLVLMVSMRLMGKRMASQLGRNEMIALVSLAAAIGVPLQAPDRGIVAAVVIAAVVVAIQQLAAWLASRNQKMESVTQGDIAILVADGVLQLRNMEKNGISKERTFAQLRSNGAVHLGQVKRLYFEAGGSFTYIANYPAVPGLGVLPGHDHQFARRRYESADRTVCNTCGTIVPSEDSSGRCTQCGSEDLKSAVQ